MADYYIAPWGDDADAATIVAPRRSLFSVRNLCSPGDTVYLLPGVYNYAGLDVGAGNGDFNDEWRTIGGTNVDPISITALYPHTAILDFTGSVFTTETRPALRLHNVNYLTISNIRIQNSPGRFINISGTSSNITLSRVWFTKCYEAGLAIGCEEAVVEDCYVCEAGLINEDYALEGAPGGGGWPIGVRASTAVTDGSADNIQWTRVHVARTWGEGGGVGQGENSLWSHCSFHNNWSVCGVYMNATAGPQVANNCHSRFIWARYNRSVVGSTGGQYGFAFATEDELDPEISGCTFGQSTADGLPMTLFDGQLYAFRSAFRHSHYQPHLDRSYRNLVMDLSRVGLGCRFALMTDEIDVAVTNRPADCEFTNAVVYQPVAQTYYEIDSDFAAWDLSGNTITVVG